MYYLPLEVEDTAAAAVKFTRSSIHFGFWVARYSARCSDTDNGLQETPLSASIAEIKLFDPDFVAPHQITYEWITPQAGFTVDDARCGLCLIHNSCI